MKKYFVIAALIASTFVSAAAQSKTADSVIIRVGKESKMILSIHDRKDLDILKHYDFQALVDDMIRKLEDRDSTPIGTASSRYLRDTVKREAPSQPLVSYSNRNRSGKRWGKNTYHSFNIDIGTNNYLSDGKFPDESDAQYGVRPWGSWYVGLNSIQRTHVAGKFFVEWGFGVSWYNFKFQDKSTLVTSDNDLTTFTKDARPFEFEKSKLTASFLNASFVPVFDFGRGGRKTTIFDGSRVDFSNRGNHSSGFRIGAGPYVGYRIGSYTKQVFKDGGDEKKSRNHDNFYLNNIRYGVRVQFGFDDVDFFFNYDLNNLFIDTKGPKLNAFSFGVTF